jgi:hypothetical protein
VRSGQEEGIILFWWKRKWEGWRYIGGEMDFEKIEGAGKGLV